MSVESFQKRDRSTDRPLFPPEIDRWDLTFSMWPPERQQYTSHHSGTNKFAPNAYHRLYAFFESFLSVILLHKNSSNHGRCPTANGHCPTTRLRGAGCRGPSGLQPVQLNTEYLGMRSFRAANTVVESHVTVIAQYGGPGRSRRCLVIYGDGTRGTFLKSGKYNRKEPGVIRSIPGTLTYTTTYISTYRATYNTHSIRV